MPDPNKDNEVATPRARSGHNAGTLNSAKESDLEDRLEALKTRIDSSKRVEEAKANPRSSGDQQGMAKAFRMSSEFIAAILVGAAIGYGIDWYFGIAPWGMIVFLMLGFGAGIQNMLRASGAVAESNKQLHKASETIDRPDTSAD